ncbi:O-antigen ligase family protein [bacterium]|nr:O-antigen ligase family protein [bacterium]
MLILIGAAALFICFAGRVSVIWALIVVSPVVFLEGISLGAIRAGKWAFVIFIVLLWFLGKAMRGEKIFIPSTSVNYFIIGFVSWGVLISLNALDPIESFINLLRMSSFFGLFYVFVDVLQSREGIRKTVGVWIGTGIFLSMLGIFQYRLSMIRYGIGQRVWATFENPNNLGIFLFLLLPVALSLFFLRGKLMKKIALGIVILLFLLCLLWTGSRSSWLATYIAFVAFGIIAKKRRFTLLLIALGAILGLAVSYSLLRGELSSLLRIGRGLAFRPILWDISWRIFLDHPLFGVGFGCIPIVFQSYYPVSILSLYKLLSPAAGSPHNLFLQIGAEMGIMGILLLLGFFTAYFLELREGLKRTRDKYYQALVMAFLATLPGLFVHSFFELSGVIGPGSYTVFFWLSVALLQAIKRMEGRTSPSEKCLDTAG